ncbi:MAG: hypothetical protein JWP84_4146 [Tardiphaga sp.]|nr:hypothetical protein [Tardiphaga sp.]
MKIALLVLLGLVLGLLGGAAVGIGAGIAWVELFKTSNFEGYSGMLVFFTFMPIGALLGAGPSCSASSRRGTLKSPSSASRSMSGTRNTDKPLSAGIMMHVKLAY